MAGEQVVTMYGPVIPRHSIYEYSTEQKHRIGDFCFVGERKFHYALAGGTELAPSKMCQGAVITAADNYAMAIAANGAIGAKSITVTGDATAAANVFTGGYIHVDSTGQYYKVKDHLALASASNTVINLYDPLAVAVTTSQYATLTQSPWNNTVVMPLGGLSAAPCGVPLITVPIGKYYWSQTWGPCGVLTQGTVVIGQDVGLGGTANGAVGPVAADAFTLLGTVLRVGASGAYSLIFLKIA